MLHTALLRMRRAEPSIGLNIFISPYGLTITSMASVVAPVSLVSLGYQP